jgi:hypothetical protein
MYQNHSLVNFFTSHFSVICVKLILKKVFCHLGVGKRVIVKSTNKEFTELKDRQLYHEIIKNVESERLKQFNENYSYLPSILKTIKEVSLFLMF